MTITRKQILTIGPLIVVAMCYAIAAPTRHTLTQASVSTARDEAIDEFPSNEPLESRCQIAAKRLREALEAGLRTTPESVREIRSVPTASPVGAGTPRTNVHLDRDLRSQWKILVREPFVLGSDLTAAELEDRYEQTIVPTVRALTVSYFSISPRDPIIVLICSSDDRFRECNLRLDDQERNQYSGIYSRKYRRIIVNIATGDGTLAHELTHALAHADFPGMPEWFEEGLASLHEECEFSADGLHLIGNTNWRREVALEALNRGELRMLADVSSNRFGSTNRANVDYAYVRSLCLYLQECGLLEPFYRTCRSNSANDSTGLRSLCQVAGAVDPGTLDDAFRAWLMSQQPSPQ